METLGNMQNNREGRSRQQRRQGRAQTITGSMCALPLALVAVLACKADTPKDFGPDPKANVEKLAAAAKQQQGQPKASQGPIPLPGGLSDAEQQAAKLASDELIKACGISKDRWRLFSRTKLEVRDAMGYRKHDLDWNRAVWITLVYRDDLEPGIGGHHLSFYLGAGKRPGIVTGKRQAIEFCGFEGKATSVVTGKPCQAKAAEDCILERAALKGLDADRKPDVMKGASGQKSAPAHCFGHGFDPPPFWTCAAEARTCKKARAAEKKQENGDYLVRTRCKATKETHCFVADGKRVVCAPDAATCVRSRKEWTDLMPAGPCQVATAKQIADSQKTE